MNIPYAWAVVALTALLLAVPVQLRCEEEPVALVNDRAITASELECAVESMVTRSCGSAVTRSREQVRAEAIQRLVDLELLFQEGLRGGYPHLQSEVERRYRQEVRRAGGEEELLHALRCNQMTTEDLKTALYRDVTIRRYLEDAVYSRIEVTEEEVRAEYRENPRAYTRGERIRLSMVLARVDTWDDQRVVERAWEKAQLIHRQAREGMDFSTLARRYSDEPGGRVHGGDQGYLTREELPADEFEELLNMPTDAVTPPLRGRQGFRVYKKVDHRPPQLPPLEELRDEIVTNLRKRKAEEAIGGLLESLRKRSRIELLSP